MGDYSLSLAAALRRLGHSTLVLGLADRWLGDSEQTVLQENAEGVAVERFSTSLRMGERIDRARARFQDFRPDWASFQMSCYAYHRKGLLFELTRHLPRLVAACANWQVMVQELWIGFQKGALWKHRLVGTAQRHFIRRGTRILHPKVLHTSTPLFQALLRTIGFEASILPLAGSIPVNAEPGTDWFHGLLGEAGSPGAAESRSGHLAAGFFGALYPGWVPEPFFSSLRKVAAKTGRKVSIFSAGRIGGAGEAIWARLPAAYPDFRFQKLGELPAARVSQYLRNLDYGIAATPWLLIGKASAAAAMLDHGLPVMVTRNDSQPRARQEIAPPSDPLLILADRDVSERMLVGIPRRVPRHSAADLAANFVGQLERAGAA